MSIKAGDGIRVRTDGGSAAAQKYAGKEGQVTAVSPGYSGIVVDVRISGNNFDTVFNESDLARKETKRR